MELKMDMDMNTMVDAFMAPIYCHVIERQTEKLRSLLGDEETSKFIEEVSRETIDIFCDAVGGDDAFREFAITNLKGILDGSIDHSDYMSLQKNEPSGIGS